MIKLDGSYLEGGGQLVRTALALSALTGIPFEVEKIRASRPSPGLKAQHIFCIKALEELCSAKAEGASLGSQHLKFTPGKINPQTVSIDIGTAGSITLLLQSLLIPSFFAGSNVRLKITGGTENKWAMPFDYFNNVFAPSVAAFVEKLDISLLRRGYYPKGNGRVDIKIKPSFNINDFTSFGDFLAMLRSEHLGFNLVEPGTLVHIQGISNASRDLEKAEVAERQARAAKLRLSSLNVPVQIQAEHSDTLSTGSCIVLWALYENGARIGADNLGDIGKRAEVVGNEAAEKLIAEIKSGAPVDSHLADSLIPFLALAGGKIRVSKITSHTLTNIYAVEQFLGKTFEVDNEKRVVSVYSKGH